MLSPICSKCGYDLTGLPSPGRCPECGQRFAVRARIGVRGSDPAYERGDRFVAKVRTWGLAITGAGALVLAVAVHVAFDKEAFLWTVGTIGLLLLMAAAMSYISEKQR